MTLSLTDFIPPLLQLGSSFGYCGNISLTDFSPLAARFLLRRARRSHCLDDLRDVRRQSQCEFFLYFLKMVFLWSCCVEQVHLRLMSISKVAVVDFERFYSISGPPIFSIILYSFTGWLLSIPPLVIACFIRFMRRDRIGCFWYFLLLQTASISKQETMSELCPFWVLYLPMSKSICSLPYPINRSMIFPAGPAPHAAAAQRLHLQGHLRVLGWVR